MNSKWNFAPYTSCAFCSKAGFVYWQEFECGDGAYTDTKYCCNECDHTWWVDGIDY